MSIRDTSAQDRPIAGAAVPSRRRPTWLIGGAIAAVAVAGVVWLLGGWNAGARSFDASRLRIAEVTRGDLVRDISAEGRVIAANSPTLYAIAGHLAGETCQKAPLLKCPGSGGGYGRTATHAAADVRLRPKRRYRGFFFGRSQPSITVCRPRASESLPAGASRVITDPAPIVASRPTRTGATSDVFDPMNAPSSIVVTCLLAPS